MELTVVIGYRLDLQWHISGRGYAWEPSLARGCHHRDRYHGVRASRRPALPHRRHERLHAGFFVQPICECAMASYIMGQILILLRDRTFPTYFRVLPPVGLHLPLAGHLYSPGQKHSQIWALFHPHRAMVRGMNLFHSLSLRKHPPTP